MELPTLTPKLRNGLIIGGLLVATTSLVVYFRRQLNLLKDACYTISGGVVHSLSLNDVKMTLFLKVVNESDLTIQLSNMEFNIYVNNMFVTKISKPDLQTLFSQSDTIIQLGFEFNPKDLLRAGLTNIESIIYDKGKLIIGIKGLVTAKTGIVKINKFPINEQITLQQILTPSTNPKKC